tara:strand:- start:413 stop:538 length:126 start_codon:yes stop_codon:yes gene_type:complete
MQTRRIHMLEVARFYQRIENAKIRQDKKKKKSLLRRLFNVK